MTKAGGKEALGGLQRWLPRWEYSHPHKPDQFYDSLLVELDVDNLQLVILLQGNSVGHQHPGYGDQGYWVQDEVGVAQCRRGVRSEPGRKARCIQGGQSNINL